MDAKCTKVFIVSESCGIHMTAMPKNRSYQKWSLLEEVVLAHQDQKNWAEVQLLATKIGPLDSLGIANCYMIAD